MILEIRTFTKTNEQAPAFGAYGVDISESIVRDCPDGSASADSAAIGSAIAALLYGLRPADDADDDDIVRLEITLPLGYRLEN